MKYYDVMIIGAGPGGYVAAEEAARSGKSVAVVDRQEIGGTCLNVGCIPSKAYLEHAHWVHTIKKAQKLGMAVEFQGADFSQLFKRKNKVVSTLQGGIQSTFNSLSIDFIKGKAEYISSKNIRVNDKEFTFNDLILATGGKPFVPVISGLSEVDFLTTDTFFSLDVLPENLVIIGGGVIAIEMAFAMEALGVKVTVLEVAPDILLSEDPDARKIIKQKLSSIMTIETEVSIKKVNPENVELVGGKQYKFDQLLVAAGRLPNVELAEDFGLSFDTQGRFVEVDEYYQTSQQNIYAIGDIIGGYTLAHAASAEGIKAVKAIVGQKERPILREMIPRSLFINPEVASFGMTEAEATAQGFDVMVEQMPFGFNGRAIAIDQTDGFIKLIVERKYGEILGSVICGPEATEILHQIMTLCESEGTVYELAATVFSHPTVSELLQDVAKAIVRKI